MADLDTLLHEIAEEYELPTELLAAVLGLERTVKRHGKRGINTRLRDLIERALDGVDGETYGAPDRAPVLGQHVLELEEIRFENFRVFGGSVHFTPGTTDERRLCLVEGENGYGKSTIIYGLLWLLGADGKLKGLEDNFRYPDRMYYRGAPAGGEMTVEAVFRSSRYGRLRIKRSASFVPSFKGAENGELPELEGQAHSVSFQDDQGREVDLQDVDAEEWLAQHFPPEVVGYFFFDAERSRLGELAGQLGETLPSIKDKVEEILGAKNIREAAKRVRKQALDHFRKRAGELDPSAAKKELRKQLEDALAKEKKAREELQRIERQLAELAKAEQAIVREVEAIKKQLQGYSSSEKVTELERRRRELRERIGSLREQLRRQLREELPLAIAEPLLANEKESSPRSTSKEWIAGARYAAKRVAELAASGRFDWVRQPPPALDALLGRLYDQLGLSSLPSPGEAQRRAERLEHWLGLARSARARLAPRLVGELKELESKATELENESKRLRQAPAQHIESLKRKQQELEVLRRNIGRLQVKKRERETDLRFARKLKEEADGKLEELVHKEERFRRYDRLASYSKRLHDALEHGLAPRIVESRLERVEQVASELLSRVTNKPGERHAIRFDRETLRFCIVDREGKPAPPDHSTGERTVVALALVWALQQASDLRLPTVLEAPLRPLDDIHADHALRELFALPPHQTVVLEVPEKIQGDALSTLAPQLASRWRLQRGRDGRSHLVKLKG